MVAIPDHYENVVAEIERRKEATISVPELSQMLGVKPTTINARFRRDGTPVSTIGRTNFVRVDLALPLVDLHKYALKGWPTLQEISEATGVKTGTLKARCEKGKLENYIDLTKRLRVNPDEAAMIRLENREPTIQREPFQPQPPTQIKKASTPFSGRPVKRASTPKSNGNTFNGTPARKPFTLPPAPEPRVQIITANDYGYSERKNEPANGTVKAKAVSHMERKRGALNYNPEKPFSISECSVGKTIKYEHYDGTIVKLIKDPFNPAIQVALPNHEEPLMREIMLRVGK